MSVPRPHRLIVNADDFGLSRGVNEGVLQAHRHGVVTSASLMVRWPAARHAADAARDCPQLSLGLHVDLGEWEFSSGGWRTVYQVASLEDSEAVRSEALRQLDQFLELVGGPPTHVDSHQHVHCHEPVRTVLARLAEGCHAPLRRFSPHIHYCGRFYGQTGKGEPLPGAITVDSLKRILDDLPPGITELSCHPGTGDGLNTMYRGERCEETRTLCDERVRRYAREQGIELISFRDIAEARGSACGRPACESASLPEGAAL